MLHGSLLQVLKPYPNSFFFPPLRSPEEPRLRLRLHWVRRRFNKTEDGLQAKELPQEAAGHLCQQCWNKKVMWQIELKRWYSSLHFYQVLFHEMNKIMLLFFPLSTDKSQGWQWPKIRKESVNVHNVLKWFGESTKGIFFFTNKWCYVAILMTNC